MKCGSAWHTTGRWRRDRSDGDGELDFPGAERAGDSPPAVILAAQGGSMSLPGVILAGTFGSWLGSAITYWTALWVERPVVMKFGKWFLMPPAKVKRAERFIPQDRRPAFF